MPTLDIDSGALLKILLHAAKHPSRDVLGVLVGRPIQAAAAAAAAEAATGAAGAASTDGTAADADNDDRKSNAPISAPSVSGRVVDALPLFHENVGLTPMLEIALLQAAAHAKARKLSLLGVYAANEHLGDQRLKLAARAAAEAVTRGVKSSGGGGGGGESTSSSSCSSSCVLLVNNGALASFSEGKAGSKDAAEGEGEEEDVLSLWIKGPGGWEQQKQQRQQRQGGGDERSSSSTLSSSGAKTLLRGAGGAERARLFAEAVSKGLVDEVWDFDDHLLDLGKDWLNAGLLGG